MSLPLPHNFSWVVPGTLAAMAWPRNLRKTLEFLTDAGVGVIVTLTEGSLNTALIEEFGFEYHHLPVRDYTAPRPEQIEEFVGIVSRARGCGTSALVHCLVGLGRSGTMAACYLVSLGRSADEALAEIRSLRPGSVETSSQKRAVHAFERRSHKSKD